jgi:hypothetical protein
MAARPIDTTDDPELEARWQALVREVIDAKAAAADARDLLIAAELRRGPIPLATPKALREVEAAQAAYRAAGERVAAAADAMKSGRI